MRWGGPAGPLRRVAPGTTLSLARSLLSAGGKLPTMLPGMGRRMKVGAASTGEVLADDLLMATIPLLLGVSRKFCSTIASLPGGQELATQGSLALAGSALGRVGRIDPPDDSAPNLHATLKGIAPGKERFEFRTGTRRKMWGEGEARAATTTQGHAAPVPTLSAPAAVVLPSRASGDATSSAGPRVSHRSIGGSVRNWVAEKKWAHPDLRTDVNSAS